MAISLADLDLTVYEQALAREDDPERVDAILAALTDELESDWRLWLRFLFPEYVTACFAPHHVEFWEYVWAIRPGDVIDPYLAVWARGGAKSVSIELALIALAARRVIDYGLYCSSTQEQADKHVATLAAVLESRRLGLCYPGLGARSIGKFGNPKGWRRNRIATEWGFTADAVGLDTAARGIRDEERRPDAIVFDDLDDKHDSPKVTQKKIESLTQTILPAGAQNALVFGVQNLVIPNGIFARLAGVAEQEADYLTTARVSGPIPAVDGLELAQLDPDERGRPRWQITAGSPTWEGQSLADCQHDIDVYGKTAFLVECQHQTQLRTGGMFRAWDWMADQYVDGPLEGLNVRRIRMWDTAGTEAVGDNDPDWTAGVLMAVDLDSRRYRIEHVVRWRAASGTTKRRARRVAILDLAGLDPARWPNLDDDEYDWAGALADVDYDRVTFGVEEEPGWHGRDWAQEWVTDVFSGFTAHKITAFGSKPERAEGLAAGMENRVVSIVRGPWNAAFLAECESFPIGDYLDQCDAAAHGYNWLRRYGSVEADAGMGAYTGLRRTTR